MKLRLGIPKRSLQDATVQLTLESDCFNSGYVVATYPLSESGWTAFVPGEMLVLEQGSMLLATQALPQCV